MDKEQAYPQNSIDFIHETTKDAITLQQTQRTSIENKANALMGFAGAVFALLMGTINILQTITIFIQMIIIFCVILFIGSVVLSLLINWTRKYRVDPEPEQLASNYLDKTESQVKLQVMSNMLDAWKSNARILERIGRLLTWAFGMQALAFILLATAILLGLILP